MRIVIALGGNALLRRGEPLTAVNQRENVKTAAEVLASVAREHELIITHGNGPQVGLLALQGAAYKSEEMFPLDILDAETEGMIGYMIEQELSNHLLHERLCATLLTQVEVDPADPSFNSPSKPIGPIYSQAEAHKLMLKRGWSIAQDGDFFRRVVPSPHPLRILELEVIKLLVDQQVIVICAGGGGIPVITQDDGSLVGVEAVIDKDMASSLLARKLDADALLMLTDVDAVYAHWGESNAQAIQHITLNAIREYRFASGSMGPKVDAACDFVEHTGGVAAIGTLKDAVAILEGNAGTLIKKDNKAKVG